MGQAFELFELEWISYSGDFSHDIGELINQPYLPFSCSLEDFIEGKEKLI